MAEINKDPQDVSEKIEEIVRLGTQVESKVFLEKLEELRFKNAHKAFDRLEFGIETALGTTSLYLYGVRKEGQKEIEERVAKEEAKNKNLEEHELREYLRLKKKFDKKKINDTVTADDL
jgi:hypothetical protein